MAQPIDDLLAKFNPQHALDRDLLMFAAGQQSRASRGWKIAVAVLGLTQMLTLGILGVVLIGGSDTPDPPTPAPPIVKTPTLWGPLEPNHWELLEITPTPENQGYPQPYITTPMIPDNPPLFAGTPIAKHLDQ